MNIQVMNTRERAASQQQRYPAVIVGCGFGGIATAIALKKDGLDNFIILERAADVGGVWRDNSYPGAACDVVSRLYSFSFDQGYDWSTNFAPQPEILKYIHRCVDTYDVRRHVRFNTEVVEATFDETAGEWTLRTRTGDTFITPIFISAAGLFNQPNIPGIPGREEFKGPQFHSARWDHSVDLTGKTVAVIGNGASGVQFIPKVAEKVKQLHLFMRTPQYVMPKAIFPGNTSWDMWLQKHKSLRGLARMKIYLTFERFIFRRAWFPLARLQGEAAFKTIVETKVKDPELRRKLTPTYPLGCKRLLVSDVWFDTMTRPNVEVIDTGIERITPDGIRSKDGTERKVDAIIYGTGFKVHDYLAPMRVTGLDGRDLNEAWRKGAEAYLGITVHGFPNFFMLYGPNTNALSSIIVMLEAQANYIVRCIRKLENTRSRYMNVRAEPQQKFNKEAQERLSHTVPAMAACTTYFKNEYGKLDTNWPGYASEYRWRTRDVRTRDYDFAPREV